VPVTAPEPPEPEALADMIELVPDENVRNSATQALAAGCDQQTVKDLLSLRPTKAVHALETLRFQVEHAQRLRERAELTEANKEEFRLRIVAETKLQLLGYQPNDDIELEEPPRRRPRGN
jgi:hypothetical protein